MQADALSALDYARYARWVRRITGRDVDLAVCRTDGATVWANLPCGIDGWLAGICAAGFDWPCAGDGMQRHDVDAATLLYMPIRVRSGAPAWLAVRTELAEQPPAEWDLLAETLEDIAAGIADDLAMKVELDSMAVELSERYEELHLVYAIDKQVQQLGPGADLFQRLLQSWAV
ncbi:MAG: hypothetical protein ACXWC4_23230, partial [Telluria sp.]